MEQYSLLAICTIAYSTCFVILGVLALVMHAITIVFPGSATAKTDAALIAAISSTVAAIIPDAQVTKIEEES